MTAKLVTFLGTEADKLSPRQFFHFPDWAVKETRRITDDFALSEGFGDAANLVRELDRHFPGCFRSTDEKPPKPTDTPTTEAPASPAEKGS